MGYTELHRTRLSTGEVLTIGVVDAAEGSNWAEAIKTFLAGKSSWYRWHIEAAFQGTLDDLATLFYVGTVDGTIVTISMLAGSHGAGIYGHVLTDPAWRQRGAAGALHEVLPADWLRRGYRAITLGTDVVGHPRKLYEAIGFRPALPNRGDMIWHAQTGSSGSEPQGEFQVSPLRWGDWGWISFALCAPPVAQESLPRSVLFRVNDVHYVDWPFIAAMRETTVETSMRTRVEVIRVGHQALGWLATMPTRGEGLGGVLIEGYLRPDVRTKDMMMQLSERVLPQDRDRLVAVGTNSTDYRTGWWQMLGLRREGQLLRWWDLGRGRENAIIWASAFGA